MSPIERTQLEVETGSGEEFRLVAAGADGRTRTFTLMAGTEYILSRSDPTEPDDLVLPVGFDAPQVSARHATIRIEGGVLVVRDLGSTNGTFGPRSERITAEQLLPLPVTIRLARDVVAVTVTPVFASRGEHDVDVDLIGITAEQALMIGRDPRAGLVLDHPAVSRRHATIARRDGGLVITDHQSLNRTYLNGEPIDQPTPAREGDVLQIGPFQLRLSANRLVGREQRGLAVTANAMGAAAHRGESTTALLRDVNLAIEPGSFVAIIGASGSGKSTLLRCLAGEYEFGRDEGGVTIAARPMPAERPAVAHLIGFLPQRETVHESLTVAQALDFTLRLRAPDRMPISERTRRIDQVLYRLEVAHTRGQRISELSGGERRRIGLAAELLTEPQVLFLDEVTSGLDPRTERGLMHTLRDIAREGTTVVCTTHHVEHIDLCEQVVLLHAEEAVGTCAFAGPPAAALRRYDVAQYRELFDAVDEAEDATVEATAVRTETQGSGSPPPLPRRPHSALRQFRTLLERRLRLLASDVRGVVFLVGQPIAVALLLVLAFPRMRPDVFGGGAESWKLAFLIAVSAIWFSTNAAARDIVRERPILIRERLAGLRLGPYLLSKFTSIVGITAVQMAMMLAVLHIFLPMGPLIAAADPIGVLPALPMLLATIAAAGVGCASGLLLSAAVRTENQATFLFPYLIIPQVILGGAMTPTLPDGSIGGVLRTGAGLITPLNWAYRTIRTGELHIPTEAEGGLLGSDAIGDPDVLTAVHDRGVTWYADPAGFGDLSYWVEIGVLAAFAALLLLAAQVVLARSLRQRH
jgi:ABC-type multidrug transport system ATPase subunit/pSer/pThr/pTyr-binding forkhead associated (FHA) protein